MATLQENILSAASQNASLMSTLAETDYAPSALAQSTSYIQSLETHLPKLTQHIAQLRRTLNKEQSEHEKYRDSTIRRLAYKATGNRTKFDERAAKEEREYLDATQEHFNGTRQLETLQAQLADAQATHRDLATVGERRAKAQADLDALYNRIFAGPTPQYPEEDAAEGKVTAATNTFNAVQLRLSSESQAANLLREAHRCIKGALKNIHDALNASEMDMMGFGGRGADMMERSAISQAQMGASQAEMLVSQARNLIPSIRSPGRIELAQGNMMSDVLFDNIFSDYSFHKKIEESQAKLLGADRLLNQEVQLAGKRVADIEAELGGCRRTLEGARGELQRIRQEVFERVGGGGGGGEYRAPEGPPPGHAPPSYGEATIS